VRRLTRGLAAVLVTVAVTPAMAVAQERAEDRVEHTITYEVERRGDVRADLEAFARRVDATLNDPRGWSLGGSVRFERVDEGGEFVLLLAAPDAVAQAHAECSARYSCRVGDEVLINDRNWRLGTPAWFEAGGSLWHYRQYVVNHEVGHHLGFDHLPCANRGEAAPVMLQQSKALRGCQPAAWPGDTERRQLGEEFEVTVRSAPDFSHPASRASRSSLASRPR
jgi:hypothetical protein